MADNELNPTQPNPAGSDQIPVAAPAAQPAGQPLLSSPLPDQASGIAPSVTPMADSPTTPAVSGPAINSYGPTNQLSDSGGPNLVQPQSFRNRLRLFILIGLSVLILGGIAIGAYAFSRNNQGGILGLFNRNDIVGTKIPLTDLGSLAGLATDQASQLVINGQLRLNNSLVLTPANQPAQPTRGQVYYNQANNKVYYFNGSAFIDVATGAELAAVQASATGSGVLSLQGQTGALTLLPGEGISISGLTIANTGVTNLQGTANQINVSANTGSVVLTLPQDINTGANPTFAGLTVGGNLNASNILASSGGNTVTLNFVAPTADVTYRLQTAAAGTYDICTTVGNCGGGGGGNVFTAGGTSGRLAKFTGSTTLADSLVSESGSTVTVNGTLAVNTITPTGALTIGSTAQNLTLQGAGSTALTVTSGGITNQIVFATPASSNKTITVPNETGTICTTGSVCTGYAPSSGGTGYVQLQGSSPGTQQSGHFNISGTGIVGTSLGIGTTPTVTFDVNGQSSNTVGRLLSGNAANFTGFQIGRVSAEADLGVAAAPTNFSSISTAGDAILRSITEDLILKVGNASGAFRFTSGAGADTEKVTILNNGNVGIGTTTFGNSGVTVLALGQAVAPSTSPADNVQLYVTDAGVGDARLRVRMEGGGVVTFPNESGTICLQSSSNCGFALSSGSGNYIQNQSGADQTADFRITGTGRANTSILTPTIDTATAVALNIGTATQTGLTLGRSGAATTLQGSTLNFNSANWQRVAAGQTTLNLQDSSNTTLEISNAGAGNADVNVLGAIRAGDASSLLLTELTGVGLIFGALGLLLQSSPSATLNSGDVAFASGGVSGGSGLTTGDVGISSGNGTGTNTSTGLVVIDAGAKSGTGTPGTVQIGAVNAAGVVIGHVSGTTPINLFAGSNGVTVRAVDSATAFKVETSGGNDILSVDSTAGVEKVILGDGNSLTGKLSFHGSNHGTNTITLQGINSPSGANVLTLPDETGTLCVRNSTSCGFAASSGSGNYIQNQSASAQSASFWVTGGGRSNTSFLAPLFDVASAGTLNIGTSFATTINLGTTNASTINLGNNAGAAVNVNLGSDQGASSTVIRGGTGDILIGVANTSDIDIGNLTGYTHIQGNDIEIGTSAVANDIDIGNETGITSVDIQCGTGTCRFGASATAHTTLIGSIVGTAQTSIQGGTGGIVVGTGSSAGVVQIGATLTEQNINIGNSTSATAVDVLCGTGTCQFGANAVAHTVTVGSTTGASALNLQAGTGNINIGTSASARTINIGTGAAVQQITVGSTNSTSNLNLEGGVIDVNGGVGVLVGDPSNDDTNLIPLVLDHDTTYAGPNCNALTPGNFGAMYYNPTTRAVRACIGTGAWEDLVSTEGLGLYTFGVIPEQNPTGQGDLVGITTGDGNTGPCKVYMGSNTTSIRWTACRAYNAGRKQVITAQSSNLSVTTGTANGIQHLCLNGTDNAPTLSTISATETANLPTFSTDSPIMCLADIKMNGAGTAIAAIYDTRVFTTTSKTFGNIVTTAPAYGHIVVNTATAGQYTPSSTTAGTGKIAGVVVSTAGGTTANTINAVIATAGPIYVKSVAGTTGDFVRNSTTAGYADTNATAPTNVYGTMGVAQSAFSNTCTASTDDCRGSLFTILNIR